jgi:methionine-gamma-lyase
MEKDSKAGPNTTAIHAGLDPFRYQGAVSVPIFQTSTFAFRSSREGAARFAKEEPGYIYTRLANPTVDALQEAVAALEGGRFALATATGMAAVSTLYLAFLDPGDLIVAPGAVYGSSRVILEREFVRYGIRSVFIDTSDEAALAAALSGGAKILFVETPANPTLSCTDIERAAKMAHAAGALLVVDNTFMSPHLQQPLRHGADIVLHSMTKFLNGHADVVAGMLVTNDEKLHARLAAILLHFGATMDPHQAWLVHRGLKTLPMRVERSQENAVKVANWLVGREGIEWVAYPGLPGHPGHRLIPRQMAGPGCLMSFELSGGIEAGRRLLDAVKLMTLAVSLGGVETLIQHPASMTHAGVPARSRHEAGITDGLVRLSVGCEDFEDIRADMEQALAAALAG